MTTQQIQKGRLIKVFDCTKEYLDETVHPSEHWRVGLGPYELRSYASAPDVEVVAFRAIPPKDMADQVVTDAKEALKLIEQVRAAGMKLPGMDYIAIGIRSALEEGALDWLRRALTGYVVLKCRELAKGRRVNISPGTS